MDTSTNLNDKAQVFTYIEKVVRDNDIVLFMKGTQDFPSCGYSSLVVRVLQKLGVNFTDIDVLSDEAVRHGIKEYTNWPTIPQLYIKGEFIGGADIIHQLYQSGELVRVLQTKGLSKGEHNEG